MKKKQPGMLDQALDYASDWLGAEESSTSNEAMQQDLETSSESGGGGLLGGCCSAVKTEPGPLCPPVLRKQRRCQQSGPTWSSGANPSGASRSSSAATARTTSCSTRTTLDARTTARSTGQVEDLLWRRFALWSMSQWNEEVRTAYDFSPSDFQTLINMHQWKGEQKFHQFAICQHIVLEELSDYVDAMGEVRSPTARPTRTPSRTSCAAFWSKGARPASVPS